MLKKTLKKFGLSDKAVEIYLTNLRAGPSSLRKLAELSAVNRGTAYNILKELIAKGLVRYYKEDKRQHYVAENPEALLTELKAQSDGLKDLETEVNSVLPELQMMYQAVGGKPKVHYYSGLKGVRIILDDLLKTLEGAENKTYQVYSTNEVSSFLYECYPEFTSKRIQKGISVSVIALTPGGTLCGLDERRWLSSSLTSKTYTLIYQDKVAMITKDNSGEVVCVLVENKNIADSQSFLFSALWERLDKQPVDIKLAGRLTNVNLNIR